jgi:hypothetical protein
MQWVHLTQDRRPVARSCEYDDIWRWCRSYVNDLHLIYWYC